MQGAGNQFFSGAAISENQNCGFTGSDHVDKCAQFVDGDALADNFLRTGQRIASRVVCISLLEVGFSASSAGNFTPSVETVYQS